MVESEEGCQALTRAAGGRPHPREAPVVPVFVAESAAWREDRGDVRRAARDRGAWSERFAAASPDDVRLFHEDLARRGLEREYAVRDAMISAAFLMVAAQAAGLAAGPMNGWDEGEVKKAIGADGREDLHVALLVPPGYPAESRLHPGRRDRADLLQRGVIPAGWGQVLG